MEGKAFRIRMEITKHVKNVGGTQRATFPLRGAAGSMMPPRSRAIERRKDPWLVCWIYMKSRWKKSAEFAAGVPAPDTSTTVVLPCRPMRGHPARRSRMPLRALPPPAGTSQCSRCKFIAIFTCIIITLPIVIKMKYSNFPVQPKTVPPQKRSEPETVEIQGASSFCKMKS